MALEEYKKKRRFDETAEPKGENTAAADHRFVVQEHHASRLHFDLRLEMDGVLKSWAVPKGPSLDPGQKHLAVMVEDHPLEYITFRGEIAEGNYGAGKVEIWDSGNYELVEGSIGEGKLVFGLTGAKLKGGFSLIRLKGKDNNWLLIKLPDEFADPNWKLEQIISGGSRRDLQEQKEKSEPEVEEHTDPMPSKISPMLATLIDKPFSDPEWLFESKFDGYRALSFIEKDKFRFASRRNEDMLGLFPQASSIPGLIDAQTAILDGEIVAIGSDGKPSFQILQNATRSLSHDAQLVYFVFDLLYYNGEDLRKRPLIERKELLKSIIRPNDFLRFSDHVIDKGEKLYEQARKAGLEGIIGKQIHSPYLEKRSNYWLKMKTLLQQEVVIAGYTQPRGSRGYFGALIVGVYEKDSLIFAGHVGTGFDDRTLKELFDLMQLLKVDSSPFVSIPKTNEPAVWLKPELVCEVKFAEWTNEGIMRQPVYLGLRQDIQANQVIREKPKESEEVVEHHQTSANPKQKSVPVEELFERKELKGDVLATTDGAKLFLTNLDKIYWPKEGYTKGDLLRYYYQMCDVVIPYLIDRPLILKRFPDGIEGESFYQHNLEDAPEFIRRVPINEKGSTINYAIIDSTASLLYIANLGCIAQNPFSSRISTLEKPDWIVLDLDPEEAPFENVCEVAMVAKSVLDEVGLVGYPKTSGARGMHVYIPIEGIYTYSQAEEFGRIVASLVASRIPQFATVERMKKERTSAQVYVDFQQNMLGKSMASPYSVRAAQGATVSTPLTWDEVASKPDKEKFNMISIPERVNRCGDIFRGVLIDRQKLTEPLNRLVEMLSAVK